MHGLIPSPHSPPSLHSSPPYFSTPSPSVNFCEEEWRGWQFAVTPNGGGGAGVSWAAEVRGASACTSVPLVGVGSLPCGKGSHSLL